ncbi:hypothetical protein [Nonomuraea turkmeniaca]|nr:hypothetical protein [Nonomuraea turkmeniaca]
MSREPAVVKSAIVGALAALVHILVVVFGVTLQPAHDGGRDAAGTRSPL